MSTFTKLLFVFGTLMHFYVAHRLYAIEGVRRRITRRAWWSGVLLVWALYLIGTYIGDIALDWRWWPGQFAINWAGLLFVTTPYLLLADVLTGFGLWWRDQSRRILAIAACGGLAASAFAFVQAIRAPAIVEHELALPGLPQQLDGTVLAAISDTHLGAQRRAAWLGARVDQINASIPTWW